MERSNITLIAMFITNWCQPFIKLQHLVHQNHQIIVHLPSGGVIKINTADGKMTDKAGLLNGPLVLVELLVYACHSQTLSSPARPESLLTL